MSRHLILKRAILAFISITICLSFGNWSYAEDIYYAQVRSGDSTGSSCTNAKAITALTWGTEVGSIKARDTLHLCGVFTGSAGNNLIKVGASGTSGNVITIKFETGAVLSAPYWSTTMGAIYVDGNSYITIDGGTNGVVTNTANGTGKTYQAESYGIHMGNGSNNIVKNLTISDIYVRTPYVSGSTGFDSEGIKFTGGNNNIATKNTIKNVKAGITYAFSSDSSNLEFSYNTFSGSDVGIIVASGPNATLTTVNIHNNDFAGEAQLWDSPGNEMHHNAIHMWAQASNSRITGVNIYSNYAHGTMGADQAYYKSTGGTHITSLFYPEEIGGTVNIYNNLLVLNTGGALNQPMNSFIFCKANTGQVCRIYNNTIVSAPGFGSAFDAQNVSGTSVHEAKNNLFYNVAYPIYTPSGINTVVADYNLYYGATNWGIHDSWAIWRAAGQDAHSSNGVDPKLSSNFVPRVGSIAIDKGVSLSSYFTTDYSGISRPQGLAWDIGAYEYGYINKIPNPPTDIITK